MTQYLQAHLAHFSTSHSGCIFRAHFQGGILCFYSYMAALLHASDRSKNYFGKLWVPHVVLSTCAPHVQCYFIMILLIWSPTSSPCTGLG